MEWIALMERHYTALDERNSTAVGDCFPDDAVHCDTRREPHRGNLISEVRAYHHSSPQHGARGHTAL